MPRRLHHVVLAAALLCGGGPAFAEAADATLEWQTLSDDGKARVATRAVPGSRVQELRITTILRWPAERLIAIVGDLEHYPSFMPHTRTVQPLGRKDHTGAFYLVVHPPVVSPRDYCVQVTIDRSPDGRMQSRFRRHEAGCPAQQPGLVRMNQVEGSWTLTPRPDGSTLVVYQAITDPAGDIPSWMVQRAAGDSLRDMFRALDRAAADQQIARCPGPSLGCFAAR